uniref:CRAL-TRIO domain-containing protein n=1 Tax=Stomoxys calcitrans TaxID=35570 RepID=A0A1I8QDS9_STOCA
MYSSPKDTHHIQYKGFTFKLDLGEPSEFAKNVARQELRETPENVKNGLSELRRLLKDESNLNCPLDNDLWLMSFLRLAHFYPEEALHKIRNYFNYRLKYPELFKDLNLKAFEGHLHDYTGSMLPQRDQLGRRLYVGLSGKYWDTQKWKREYPLRSFILQCESLRCEPETQICGIVILLDMENLTIRQSLHYTLGFLKSLIEYLQDGMGIRLKGYHILNQPKIVNALYTMSKPFIREKFVNRLHFHGSDMASLHRHIAPECLPECYGGTLKAARQSYGPQIYELLKKYEKDRYVFSQYGCSK